MDVTALQYSDSVSLAQSGKIIDQFKSKFIEALISYNLPPQLENTGLIFSKDESHGIRGSVHGRTFVTSFDHLLGVDALPIKKLLGRVTFREKVLQDEGPRILAIIFDEYGNTGIQITSSDSCRRMHDLRNNADLEELCRQVSIAIVGAIQNKLEKIDL